METENLLTKVANIESIFKISKVDLVYIKKWAIRDSTIDILKQILEKLN